MTTTTFLRPLMLAAGVLLIAACDEKKQAAAPPAMPPMTVATVTVQPETLPVVANLPGRIAATRVAEVRPRVSGIIVQRTFTQGATVKEGDVLYRIDPAPFRVQVDSAQAALRRAEAAQVQARQTSDRQAELRDRNVVSAQTRDNAVAALAQANADVAAARAGLAAAQLDLQYSEVRAPISGRIGRALITEGALVTANNAEPLATVQQLDPVYADFTQSANEVLALRRALREGTLNSTDGNQVAARMYFDDGTEYAHPGKLLFSEATVDTTTGQIILRGEFPNPDSDLLPGMYVRVKLEQGVQTGALAVPQQAVQRDSSGAALLYVRNAEGKVEVRQVTAGRVVENRWVIDAGLQPGTEVIVEGFQKLRPGAAVTGKPWTAPVRTGAAQPAQR